MCYWHQLHHYENEFLSAFTLTSLRYAADVTSRGCAMIFEFSSKRRKIREETDESRLIEAGVAPLTNNIEIDLADIR